jgi:hypothetical protein
MDVEVIDALSNPQSATTNNPVEIRSLRISGLCAQFTCSPWQLEIVQEIEATACEIEADERGILGFRTSSQNLL